MQILLQALVGVGLSLFNKIIKKHGEEFFEWILFRVAAILVERTDTKYDDELLKKITELKDRKDG